MKKLVILSVLAKDLAANDYDRILRECAQDDAHGEILR